MLTARNHLSCFGKSATLAGQGSARALRLSRAGKWVLAALPLFLVSLLFAQTSAKVTAMDPTTGKVNDNVTLTGQNLGKDSVSGVNLTDADKDFEAAVVEQSAEKIVMKVPRVKAGAYNLSIQVKDRILILPIRFTVTE